MSAMLQQANNAMALEQQNEVLVMLIEMLTPEHAHMPYRQVIRNSMQKG